jgi:hypothetical protein
MTSPTPAFAATNVSMSGERAADLRHPSNNSKTCIRYIHSNIAATFSSTISSCIAKELAALKARVPADYPAGASMFEKQPPTPLSASPIAPDRNLSSTITPLNSSLSRNSERTNAIGAIVDGFRNLRASVVRFISMLDDLRGGTTPREDLADHPLSELLPLLEKNARAVDFGQIDDLMSAIETAYTAEHQRDLIFSASLGDDIVRLQEIARNWERLDAIFVGLCVEHVLQAHYRGHKREPIAT